MHHGIFCSIVLSIVNTQHRRGCAVLKFSAFSASLIFIFFGIANTASAAVLQNQLQDNPSAYLALHGSDPVAWQEWNDEVLAKAKAENKLIFLSIGYFSCHWCHVMQRESYKDRSVAAVINEQFIPVKIDRELEEALDARMIEFTEKTRGRAGWPLNVFITPEGYPLHAALYLPRDEFLQLLNKLQELWTADNAGMKALAEQDKASEEPLASHRWNSAAAGQLMGALTYDAMERGDPVHGGFGEQNKFPSTPQLNFLLDSLQRQANPQLKSFLNTTLQQMASQGLRDHVGGGFFRYTTDPDWQTPHFEKMLYDNAQLAVVYLRAAMVLAQPRYLAVAKDTLQFMQRELQSQDGAMIASLSAIDDNDVEGGFYLWTRDQLKKLLTDEERQLIEAAWLPKSASHFDAGYLPVWVKGFDSQQALTKEQQKLLQSATTKMLTKRQQDRSLPADDKLLAGWNGLALTAFSQAAKQLDDADFRKTATAIAGYITTSLWQGDRLVRARKVGNASREMGQASLADYANVAEGMWFYYQLTGDSSDLQLLQSILDAAWKRFYTPAGWSLGSMAAFESSGRQGMIADGPQASPSSLLLAVSYRVALEAADKALAEKVKTALGYDAIALSSDPFWYASQVRAIYEVFAQDDK